MTADATITPGALAQWNTDAVLVRDGIGKGRLWLRKVARALQAINQPELPALVAELQNGDDTLFAAQQASTRLLAGVKAAADAVSFELPAPGSLILPLAQLDTPDTRELLAALEKALEIAERVDRARGRHIGDHLPLQSGESAGTDLAESISILTLRLRGEVRGACSPHE